MHALGLHVLIELYGCDAQIIDQLERVTEAMLEAARRSGATIISHHLHRFSPQGISGVVIIAESHLAIHTWPEHGYVAADIFTCGERLEAQEAVDVLKTQFRAARVEVTRLARGLTQHLHQTTD
ncbi:MAG: adenosylmethionine decarboxylase [Myxococcota bacterium]